MLKFYYSLKLFGKVKTDFSGFKLFKKARANINGLKLFRNAKFNFSGMFDSLAPKEE